MRIDELKASALEVMFKRIDRESCIVFLFGSSVGGHSLQSSDIDIGVLSSQEIPARAFVETQEELDESLPTLRHIELVDFRTVSDVVKREALKEIEIWHTGTNCRGLLKSLRQAVKN